MSRSLSTNLPRTLVLGGLGAALLVASVALGRTAVSGHSGTETVVEAGKGYLLYAIDWSERQDDPCYLKAYFAKRKGDGTWESKQKELKTCSSHPASMKQVSFQHPSGDEARFVAAIEVCTNDRKSSTDEMLKGIRIYARRVNAKTAKVSVDDAKESSVRNHCKTWHKKVQCPAGEVATSLRVQTGHGGGNSQGAFRGIALDCAKP